MRGRVTSPWAETGFIIANCLKGRFGDLSVYRQVWARMELSGSMELSQAGILRGAGVILGTPPKLLEAMLEFGQAP